SSDKKVLANLFSMMLDEGAGKFDALEISNEFEVLGANFNISCGSDSILINLQTLTEHFDRSLELMSTIVTSPHFKSEDFDREKRKVLIKILQIKDDIEDIASSLFDYISFNKSNPYAFQTIGYEDTVKKISVEDIKNFYHDYFTPNNSALAVAGNISLEELRKKLNKNFKVWKSKKFNSISINQTKKSKTKVYLFDKKGSVQSEIRIGHVSSKRNEGNYFAKYILNTVLGGQFSSRINLNLREDKGYTYGAFSAFSYYKDDAYFYVSTSVGQKNTANAVNEIIKELNKILDGVEFEELGFAQSSIIRKFPSNFETFGQIASNLSSKIIHSLPDDYFNTFIKNIHQVTIDDVTASAKRNIFPDKLVIVVVGDKDNIVDSLKRLKISDEILELNLEGKIINRY
ncbi:MAG: pitrilysin family protein, partial [Ignavibacteriaceae bacterium]